MIKKGIIYSALLLGAIIGAGATKFIYDNGLFSFLDFEEYINGLTQGSSGREYNFEMRAHLSGAEYFDLSSDVGIYAFLDEKKEWSEIVNTREFQKLSSFEQTKLRGKYYTEIIYPTLPKLGTEDAEDKFHKYASVIEVAAEKYGFFEEPLNLPTSGKQLKHALVDYVAPLEIKTRNDGYHYFVKISDWETDIPILSVFIRSGDVVNVNVPIGTFSLKYATGKTWYGEEYLFGPETSRSKAEKSFDFKASSDGISGYTVELYRQLHGNLPTKSISQNEW